MVNEGIVLGHKISERGIEVHKAKVDAIEKSHVLKTKKVFVVFSVILVLIGDLLRTSLNFVRLSQIFYQRMFHLFFMMIA